MAFGMCEYGIPHGIVFEFIEQRVLWRPSANLNENTTGSSETSVQVKMVSNIHLCIPKGF